MKFETRGPATTEMTVDGIQNSTNHQEKSRFGTISYTSHIFFKNVCPQSLIIFSVDVSAMHKTLKLHVFTRWVLTRGPPGLVEVRGSLKFETLIISDLPPKSPRLPSQRHVVNLPI